MHQDCTLYNIAGFIGKKWTLLILFELHKGKNKQRYSELKKNLPQITPKLLSLRLKELEQEKLITKQIDTTTFPIKCEYALTNSGNAFINIIQDVKSWALKWRIKSTHCNSTSCEKCTL